MKLNCFQIIMFLQKFFWFNVYLLIHFLRIKTQINYKKIIHKLKISFFFPVFVRIIIHDKLSNYQKRKKMFGKYFWVC